jgi:hypothetical protein
MCGGVGPVGTTTSTILRPQLWHPVCTLQGSDPRKPNLDKREQVDHVTSRS